jgi:hypothetical protein
VEYGSTAPAPSSSSPCCRQSIPRKATTPTKPITRPAQINLFGSGIEDQAEARATAHSGGDVRAFAFLG